MNYLLLAARELAILVFVVVLPLSTAQSTGHETRSTASDLELRIDRLIEQLGAQEFSLREDAQSELLRLGVSAFDALYRAQNHGDIEIAMRAHYLVRSIRIHWTDPSDSAEVRSILKGYGELAPNDRASRIQLLAALESGKGAIALCRLARFEESTKLSKKAALFAMRTPRPDNPNRRLELLETIRRNAGSSQRTAVRWIRLFAEYLDDAEATVDQWDQLVREEESEFRESEPSTSLAIVRDLMHWQVEMLTRMNHDQEALEVMKRTVTLRNGAPGDLMEAVDWLLAKSAWEVIDELAKQHQQVFEENARLLYRLAEAKLRQGHIDKAQGMAERALSISESTEDFRFDIATLLRDRGLFDWAEREFRQILDAEKKASSQSINSAFWLSEMLHDQQRELAAAEVLAPICERAMSDKNFAKRVERYHHDVKALTSRMYFFRAEHYRMENDVTRQRQNLQSAIEANATDADVLIAMHRVETDDDKWRTMTTQRIEETARSFRQIIENLRQYTMEPGLTEPERDGVRRQLAMAYNQYAWLVANTEGDQQYALECSLKSLELRPNTAGYLDTLGRCYYAIGDLENAVIQQRKAVALDPHVGQMLRQLALFERALEESEQSQVAPFESR